MKKALLVIDMQNVCVGKNHATWWNEFDFGCVLYNYFIGESWIENI